MLLNILGLFRTKSLFINAIIRPIIGLVKLCHTIFVDGHWPKICHYQHRHASYDITTKISTDCLNKRRPRARASLANSAAMPQMPYAQCHHQHKYPHSFLKLIQANLRSSPYYWPLPILRGGMRISRISVAGRPFCHCRRR